MVQFRSKVSKLQKRMRPAYKYAGVSPLVLFGVNFFVLILFVLTPPFLVDKWGFYIVLFFAVNGVFVFFASIFAMLKTLSKQFVSENLTGSLESDDGKLMKLEPSPVVNPKTKEEVFVDYDYTGIRLGGSHVRTAGGISVGWGGDTLAVVRSDLLDSYQFGGYGCHGIGRRVNINQLPEYVRSKFIDSGYLPAGPKAYDIPVWLFRVKYEPDGGPMQHEVDFDYALEWRDEKIRRLQEQIRMLQSQIRDLLGSQTAVIRKYGPRGIPVEDKYGQTYVPPPKEYEEEHETWRK